LGRAHIAIEPDYLVLVEREIHVHDGSQYHGLEPWNRECTRLHAEVFKRIQGALPALVDWISSRFHARIYEDPYSPLCLVASNLPEADAIHEYLNSFCQAVSPLTVVRNDVYIRFSHDAYNKGTALGELCRRLGIGVQEVFAIGDHLNDLPMLSRTCAQCLAAPSNAVPTVIAAVRREGGYVCNQPRGRGVAEALRHFLGYPAT
jgi:hydroxymethylpyrimidine pyrophosphatase-like HAD family hydrolase